MLKYKIRIKLFFAKFAWVGIIYVVGVLYHHPIKVLVVVVLFSQCNISACYLNILESEEYSEC
jgi:hypothetical protein